MLKLMLKAKADANAKANKVKSPFIKKEKKNIC